MKTEMLIAKLTEATSTPTVPHEVTDGKYGSYPCCRATYKRLKLLNFLLFMTKRQRAAEDRYYAKDPKNRVIRKQNKVKLDKPIPLPEPVEPFLPMTGDSFNALEIELSYMKSRYPQKKEDVKPLTLPPARIDELLALVLNRVAPQEVAA